MLFGLLGPKKIKQERIIERWSVLLEEAHGESEKIIAGVLRTIEKLEAPNIFITRKELRSDGNGFIKDQREFLVAEHKFLSSYDMYVSARDYGKQLFVSWYLIQEPLTFWRIFKRNPIRAILGLPFLFLGRLMSKLDGGSGELVNALNLFDNEELTAYVATVHHALLDSVKELMENRNLDFTKIDQKTRGFLNIS